MSRFSIEKINARLWRLKDPAGVAVYLAEGSRYAALLDTGYGFRGLKTAIRTLTAKPVIVLLTHGHVDHAFGIYEFDEIYMNHADQKLFEAHADLSFRINFLDRMLKKRVSENDLQPEREIEFIDIQDEMIFDLGGIHIQAWLLPGHTKGSVVYLFQEDRMLLLGDAAGPGTLLIEDFSANISVYRKALIKVKASTKEKCDIILRNHGTCVSNKDLLERMIILTEEILECKDAHVELTDQVGEMFPTGNKNGYKIYSGKAAKFNGFGIVEDINGNINYREDKVK